MLGVLAKYIFGGMMGDAPETTAPELQYHTREVNDWLLVDMPDQAIDDEDIDSENDEDEILTALPLLMAEEVIVQPLQIVQSYEDAKDYSVCDISYDKVQRRFVEKIRSVPSAVQHHSSDKTQGNYVDNVEAVSVEVQDNFSAKISDISADAEESSDNTIQDKSNAQVWDVSVFVQKNSIADIQEAYDDRKQSILSEVQVASGDEPKSNSVTKVESVSIEENFIDKRNDVIHVVPGNIDDDVLKLSDNKVLHGNSDDEINRDSVIEVESVFVKENSIDKINHFIAASLQENIDDEVQIVCDTQVFEDFEDDILSVSSEIQENSDDKITTNFRDDVGKTAVEVDDRIENFCAELEKLYDEYARDEVQRNSDRIQVNLNCGSGEFYPESCNRNPISYAGVQKRLYSEVVQMCGKSRNSPAPIQNTFGVQLGNNYECCVRTFDDEIQGRSDDEMNESSDDEMDESSNDEMDENSNDEMNENSDADDDVQENFNEGSRRDSYDAIIQLSSDEEGEEYSEDDTLDIYIDFFHRHFQFIPSKINSRNREQKGLSPTLKLFSKGSKHGVKCASLPKHERTVSFELMPQCWDTIETWYNTGMLRVTEYFPNEPTEFNNYRPGFKNLKNYLRTNAADKKFKRRVLQVENKSPSPDASSVTNSAEILQNVINQKSTILPTKTAVVLEHIKDLKPGQQAIQFENRKYLTRSQLNRQNRNYIYQSSVKTNRRKNLQRNPSGANNNRKC